MPSQPDDAARSPQADLLARAIRGDETAVRSIIRDNNRRLFRVARSMVRDDGEAEDVLQEAYLRAFTSLASFRGECTLATWLTRIVVNEALQRLRRRVDRPLDTDLAAEAASANVIPFPMQGNPPVDPERAVAQRQLGQLVERAIDALPIEFRTVLVARVLEDMSVEETAELLGLRPETVKTRLHRARRLLKEALLEHIDPLLGDVFPFDGDRCQRLTDAVVACLDKSR